MTLEVVTDGEGVELTPVQNPYDLFVDAVAQVEAGDIPYRELLTFSYNPITGERNTYSALAGRVADPNGPSFSAAELEEGLTMVVNELTGELDGRKNIEGSLNDEPAYRAGDYESGFETQFHEWQTVRGEVIVGVKTVRSDRGVLQKTWYVADAPVRKRLLPQNRFARAVVIFFRPELGEDHEITYFPQTEY